MKFGHFYKIGQNLAAAFSGRSTFYSAHFMAEKSASCKQTLVHKITNLPVFYMELILHGFETDKSITQGFAHSHFTAQKVFISRAHPFQCPSY